MCGIAGRFHITANAKASPFKAAHIERMTSVMAHRGPDHQGVRLLPHAALGFRRLSIIDLSPNANQPMANEDESLWLLFNGEIYNFQSLRQQLIALGHHFRSQGDGEVVLHGFESWGLEVFNRLEGMFAVALYRPRDHYLCLARDPYGMKPLYYSQTHDELAMASEIKALLTLPNISAKLNTAALLPYLTLGYVPQPATLFANIQKLAPGHHLQLQQGKITLQRYWQLAPKPSHGDLRQELKSSVQRCLVSDVPLGVFLSGGLDSALLTLLAQENRPTPLKTFAIGFKDYPHYDESAKSDYVAAQLKTEHHNLTISEDASQVMGKVMRALEEPLADPSIIPTYHLAAMTKGFVTVALSGEGGDEFLGGYLRYYWEQQLRPYYRWLRPLAPILLPLLQRLPTPDKQGFSNFIRRSRKLLATCALDPAARYLQWYALISHDDLKKIMHPDFHALLTLDNPLHPQHRFAQLLQEAAHLTPLQQLQYVDINTMLVDNLLLKADKIGMSQSLEMRLPLLNNPLATALYGLPDAQKIHGGVTKVWQRQQLAPHFNAAFVQQAKRGFEVPIGQWLRQEGASFMQSLLPPATLECGLWQPAALQAFIDEHMQGKRDHGLALFAIGMLGQWLQSFEVSI